jgi:Icc protein
MTARSICWAHLGDLHLDAEDPNGPWHSRDLLAEIVAELNAHATAAVDFVYLPGDTANHGTRAQYRQLLTAIAPLSLPWRSIPGDHDFEPGDLAADGEEIARMFADGGVALVDTGHTHYNELLDDGRVIYAATRSTGQIEEDGGAAGFAIVCVHEGVASWRFRRLDAAWPHVQIVAPSDARLVTRPADPLQVPRPGEITVTARILGATAEAEASVRVDDGPPTDPWRIDGVWTARVPIERPGLHRVEVTCAGASDRIDLLVRAADAISKRRPPVALGHAYHAIGAWPIAGIDGFQLGPNKNGRGW